MRAGLSKLLILALALVLAAAVGCTRASVAAEPGNPLGGGYGGGEPFLGELPAVKISDAMERPTGAPRSPAPVVSASYQPEADASAPTIERKIVYSGRLGLRVANARTTAAAIEALVEREGGRIENATLDSIRFRVAPGRFAAVMEQLESMGEVFDRGVFSDDITAQYVDAELRLATAMASRDRLIELTGNVVDTKGLLEIERDLRRLVEEIETIKGRLRVMADQVQDATITVNIQEKVADDARSPHREQGSPFAWIGETGLSWALVPVAPDAPLRHRRLFTLLESRFQLGGTTRRSPAPEGLAPLRHTREELVAATPENFRLRARVVEARQAATLEFWTDALVADLRDSRGYILRASEAFPVSDGKLAARRVEMEASHGGEAWLHDTWLVMAPGKGGASDELLVVEFARLKMGEPVDVLSAVEQGVAGVKLR